ncbi:hypothetical protein XmelCFBP4644_16975 [Xanthomonas melonis]|uniref:Uncharacterized protein n=1 Tax=Xanthomonas melonis TaxID=56456 RepID=A0A2S7DBK2_9XANT|nr:hypothetical protein XmelCFBP4644_16975 [Xanthomonas melonis]
MRYLLVIALLLSGGAHAVEVTANGKLSFVENGWYGEGLSFAHSAPVAGCTGGANNYVIDKNHPSYQELLAIALTAYTRELDVKLIVEPGVCGFGVRTKILAMRLAK